MGPNSVCLSRIVNKCNATTRSKTQDSNLFFLCRPHHAVRKKIKNRYEPHVPICMQKYLMNEQLGSTLFIFCVQYSCTQQTITSRCRYWQLELGRPITVLMSVRRFHINVCREGSRTIPTTTCDRPA